MNWVKKQKLLAIEVLCFNGQPCIELNELWQALYQSFNLMQDHQINMDILNEIPIKQVVKWKQFLNREFKNVITQCNSSSILEPDRVLWKHLKWMVENDLCLVNIVNITNICINLGHWLLHFKRSSSIIISKLNKTFYNAPKSFHPIVLLNMLEKLIEKCIGERL